jgi:hypothetical protein
VSDGKVVPFPGNAARSPVYQLMRKAMAERKQVVCFFGGFPREVCPIIIGRGKGRERVFVYQFGGGSSTGLRPGGDWRCLDLARVTNVALRDGPWIVGGSHTREQPCIDEVDLDVNVPGAAGEIIPIGGERGAE